MTMKFKIQAGEGCAPFHPPFALFAFLTHCFRSAPDSVNSKPDDHLPLAHTCFFSIALPSYSSKEILRSKLLYAIKNCKSMDSDFRLHNSDLTLTRSM